MSSKFLLGLGASVLLLAACETTTAAPKPQAAKVTKPAAVQTASTEDTSDKDAMVCKKMDVIGTIVPKKVCMTQKQWDRQSEAGTAAANDAQRNALRTAAPGQGT